jgi:hypothetical protein
VRWLVSVALLSFVYGATVKRECSVSDFVNIAYSNNDTKERHDRIVEWLDDSGQVCTKQQLVLIYTNLAQVLGAADTMRVRTKIDKLWEKAK